MEMKQDSTEIVFVIDKSGSMNGLESDTIGGFNSAIDRNRDNGTEAFVTTVLFDTEMTRIHDRIPIKDVPKLTREEYAPEGCTALLDAVGETIQGMIRARSFMKEAEIPARTLFMIMTDGYENSSKEYRYDDVKKLIEARKEAGWEFVFMGANIDVAAEAENIGIGRDRAMKYECSSDGLDKLYERTSKMMSCCMCSNSLDEEWDEIVKNSD